MEFNNILDYVIPIENFALNWRFTDTNYDKLPDDDLNKLKPLDNQGSKYLWEFLEKKDLHKDIPFKKDFFAIIDTATCSIGNEKEVKNWLCNIGISFDKEVFLSWSQTESMVVPWEILIKYFDSFYYTSSDDLTVFDENLNWALLFFHTDDIYFGAKQGFRTS